MGEVNADGSRSSWDPAALARLSSRAHARTGERVAVEASAQPGRLDVRFDGVQVAGRRAVVVSRWVHYAVLVVGVSGFGVAGASGAMYASPRVDPEWRLTLLSGAVVLVYLTPFVCMLTALHGLLREYARSTLKFTANHVQIDGLRVPWHELADVQTLPDGLLFERTDGTELRSLLLDEEEIEALLPLARDHLDAAARDDRTRAAMDALLHRANR